VNQTELESKVRKIIAERLIVDESNVTNTAELIVDLGADSLDLIELIMAMEEEFKLEILDREVEHIKTVGQGIDFLKERLDISG